MILVTGATGNVGAHVVGELRERRAPVRAFVRDAQRARERLGDEVELAIGDFGNRASLESALENVEAVFLTSANGPQEVEHETAVIDAARAASVRRLVKLSTLGAEAGSAVPGLDWHGQIEERLRKSGVPSVVLQSNFFMTNLLAAAEPIARQGALVAPAHGGRISMIDPRDVAAVAAALLVSSGYEGETIVVTGPEAITYAQVAAELSLVTARQVEFVDVPDQAAREEMVAAGMPEWLVEHVSRVFAIANEGALEPVTSSVRDITGREPRRFAEFALDHAQLFGALEAARR